MGIGSTASAGKKYFDDAADWFEGAWGRQGGTDRAAKDMIAAGHREAGFAREEAVAAEIEADHAKFVGLDAEATNFLQWEYAMVE
ncbi:hypothetical protein A1O3_06290 [Capronia epimyces CBS 606.96]|uniref:Uncharacterized protein n=1 Tax=Capronia epimyces CBS 606.96 TaxID=1182542 RepID=W9XPL6_9EURO|nr:uncharacterized protein A1O3_06290 [Capronia epimyces CBS 606.96]EXJ82477.1 hypothetical protein A1O3_06290 [Capronia epimyces CBS 606.96]